MNPPTPPYPAIGMPRKTLGVLVGGVVAAHVLVLQLTGNAIEADSRAVTRPFVTRAVTLSTQAADAPAASAPAPAAVPRRRVAAVRPAATRVNVPTTAEAQMERPQQAADVVANQEAEVPAPLPASAASAPVLPDAPAVVAAAAPVAAAVDTAPRPPPASQPPVAAVAYTVPGSVRLNYKVEALIKNQPWNMNGEFLWLQDGATYDARLTMSLLLVGTKTYTSTGRVGAEGLLPQRFGDKFRSSEVAAHFERDKQQITFSANTPSAPLKPGMQDWLSTFVQIGAMFAGAPAQYPSGTRLTFDIVGARSVDAGVFVVEAEEKLQLPGGEINAVKLTRAPRQEFDQSIQLWLAPQLGYLPARIKITERNGDFFDQQWRATETP